MTFTHTTGAHNVEATLTAWLFEQLIANKPDTVDTVYLNMEYPEKPLECPVWSITFTGAESDGTGYEGGYVSGGQHGNMMFGIADVSAWVSRSNDNWRAQLRQMVDAVTKALNNLYAIGGAIIIKDFYTSATAPADTIYKMTIERWALRPPPVDPNPDIERQRVVIFYQWVERV